MKMPFGKYEKKDIRFVPLSYIVWLLENDLTNPRPMEARLRSELIDSMSKRLKLDKSKTNTDPLVNNKYIYKKMAVKYHPDKEGGSHQAFIAITDYYETMEKDYGSKR